MVHARSVVESNVNEKSVDPIMCSETPATKSTSSGSQTSKELSKDSGVQQNESTENNDEDEPSGSQSPLNLEQRLGADKNNNINHNENNNNKNNNENRNDNHNDDLDIHPRETSSESCPNENEVCRRDTNDADTSTVISTNAVLIVRRSLSDEADNNRNGAKDSKNDDNKNNREYEIESSLEAAATSTAKMPVRGLLRGFSSGGDSAYDSNVDDVDLPIDSNNDSPRKKAKYSILDAWNYLEEEVLLEKKALTLPGDNSSTGSVNNKNKKAKPKAQDRDRIAWVGIVRDTTVLLSVPHKNALSPDVAKVAKELLTVTSEQTRDPISMVNGPAGWVTKSQTNNWNWYGYRGMRFPIYERGLKKAVVGSPDGNPVEAQATFAVNNNNNKGAPGELSVWMYLCVYDSAALRPHQVKEFMEQEMIQMTQTMRQYDQRWREGFHYCCQASYAPILLQVLNEVNLTGTDFLTSSSSSKKSALQVSNQIVINNRAMLEQRAQELQEILDQLYTSCDENESDDKEAERSKEESPNKESPCKDQASPDPSKDTDQDKNESLALAQTTKESRRPPFFIFKGRSGRSEATDGGGVTDRSESTAAVDDAAVTQQKKKATRAAASSSERGNQKDGTGLPLASPKDSNTNNQRAVSMIPLQEENENQLPSIGKQAGMDWMETMSDMDSVDAPELEEKASEAIFERRKRKYHIKLDLLKRFKDVDFQSDGSSTGNDHQPEQVQQQQQQQPSPLNLFRAKQTRGLSQSAQAALSQGDDNGDDEQDQDGGHWNPLEDIAEAMRKDQRDRNINGDDGSVCSIDDPYSVVARVSVNGRNQYQDSILSSSAPSSADLDTSGIEQQLYGFMPNIDGSSDNQKTSSKNDRTFDELWLNDDLGEEVDDKNSHLGCALSVNEEMQTVARQRRKLRDVDLESNGNRSAPEVNDFQRTPSPRTSADTSNSLSRSLHGRRRGQNRRGTPYSNSMYDDDDDDNNNNKSIFSVGSSSIKTSVTSVGKGVRTVGSKLKNGVRRLRRFFG